ncbi:Hypothetical_protein [Hexamita inflata]|uniref:Hypothetical_protein n=1 Tax=Hexamita inflata TaxID=28002 RepID=A0ABP1JRX6_9EUKA
MAHACFYHRIQGGLWCLKVECVLLEMIGKQVFIRFVKDSVKLIQHDDSFSIKYSQQTKIYKITKRFSYPQSQNQTVYPKSNNRANHAILVAHRNEVQVQTVVNITRPSPDEELTLAQLVVNVQMQGPIKWLHAVKLSSEFRTTVQQGVRAILLWQLSPFTIILLAIIWENVTNLRERADIQFVSYCSNDLELDLKQYTWINNQSGTYQKCILHCNQSQLKVTRKSKFIESTLREVGRHLRRRHLAALWPHIQDESESQILQTSKHRRLPRSSQQSVQLGDEVFSLHLPLPRRNLFLSYLDFLPPFSLNSRLSRGLLPRRHPVV